MNNLVKGMNVYIIQPSVPTYRLDFFERLVKIYNKSIKVYYSPGNLGGIDEDEQKSWSVKVGGICALPMNLFWQPDVAWLKIDLGDVVVLSGNPRYLSTLILLLRAKIKGAHVVWWGHYWSSTSKRWRQIFRLLLMTAADALLFYTDDEISSYFNDPAVLIKKKKVFSLNNGINIDPIIKYRKKYSADSRENAMLFIGRITKKAKLELLLKAMSKIGQGCPKLYVIGEGEKLGSSKKLSAELDLSDRVEWCGALKEESEISKVANKCRLFIYPGSVGLSLIHAMAYGLPAIVHDCKQLHMPEFSAFKNEITGNVFPYDDSIGLANTIMSSLLLPDRLNEFSKNSISIVEANYNTSSMALRFEKMINTLVS